MYQQMKQMRYEIFGLQILRSAAANGGPMPFTAEHEAELARLEAEYAVLDATDRERQLAARAAQQAQFAK